MSFYFLCYEWRALRNTFLDQVVKKFFYFFSHTDADQPCNKCEKAFKFLISNSQ